MNCRQLQNDLYEYVEGSLSAAAQAAAEKHLEECLACRERLREEQEVARSMAATFRQATAHLELPAAVSQRVAARLAAERAARNPGASPGSLWRRLAWPVAWAAAAIALLAGWLAFVGAPTQRMAAPRPHPSTGSVYVQLAVVTPIHTFRREGGLVVDAVTYQTNIVNQRLQMELASLK